MRFTLYPAHTKTRFIYRVFIDGERYSITTGPACKTRVAAAQAAIRAFKRQVEMADYKIADEGEGME